MPNPFLDAALYWAARGFRVFPVAANGTKPVYEGWPTWATTNPDQVRALWEGTDYNIGICTTGLLVVDLDTKPDKATGLPRRGVESWMALHGAFDTLTIRTRSGGYHLYYTGADVGLSAGALGEGVDVRSHNGYVIAPGSLIDGQGYEITQDIPMAPAPPHVVALCKPPGQRVENAGTPLVDLDSAVAVQQAQERIARTPGAVSGERSDGTYRLAAAVRDYGISELMCVGLMEEWAARCSPPIDIDDLRPIVENAYLYAQNAPGQRHPEILFGQVNIEPPPPPEPEVPALAAGDEWGNASLLNDLQRRPHVLRGLLLSGGITALISPGGVGKSMLALTVAAHIAMGVDCLGFQNVIGHPAKSAVYNAEDDLNEMSMRLHGICMVFGFPFEQVRANIRLISGKTHQRVRFVTGGQSAPQITPAVGEFITALQRPDVVFAAFDPLNKLHNVNGSDNSTMTFVMETIEMIAQEAGVAAMVAHHTSKPAFGAQRAGNADAGQGASTVKDSSRLAFTLFPPQDEDCQHYGLRPEERGLLLRLDHAKDNYGPANDKTIWLRRVPTNLWVGESVAPLERTEMAVRTEHMTQSLARTLAANMIHHRGTAGMKLKEAAGVVRGADPMFDKVGVTVTAQRIQQLLGAPVTLEDGTIVQCRDDGHGWMVVIT